MSLNAAVVTILGSLMIIFGVGILLFTCSSKLDPLNVYGGKTLWLERSADEPYFWSVSALDDHGTIRFVNGWREYDKAHSLFMDLAEGRLTRKWVRENAAKEQPRVVIEVR